MTTRKKAKPSSSRRSTVCKPDAELLDVLRFAVGRSSLGTIFVAISRKGVAAIVLADNPRPLRDWFPKSEFVTATSADEVIVAQITAHIDDPTQPLRFKLDLRGTPFQNKVWNAVRKIPAGTTLTYADIAKKIGAPRAMRAVGSSCAKCRHWFAVPCHRVIAGGNPNAARPGSDRRAELLNREMALLKRP